MPKGKGYPMPGKPSKPMMPMKKAAKKKGGK